LRGLDGRCLAAPLLAAGLAAFAGGCASNPAPQGWLPKAVVAQRTTRGGWIVVERKKDAPGGRVAGELIAVEEDRIYVLDDSGLQTVERGSIEKMNLAGYATDGAALGGWAALGTLSTLSHGKFLVLTAPLLWLAGGIASAADESRGGFAKPGDFQKYARFPQGLPPGLDADALGPLMPRANPD